MKHSTLILVIRRLSERARTANSESYRTPSGMLTLGYRYTMQEAEVIERKCRAKIDQLTERYS